MAKDTKAERTKPVAKGSRQQTISSKGAEWTFPQDTLEDSIRIAKAIEEKHAGKPMAAALLAKAVGYNQPKDWRFLRLLRSSNAYGLVSGSGATATVSLGSVGQDIVAPSSPLQRQKALLEAFRQVEDFRRVEEFYRGKRIPEDEFFQNTLAREFGIPRERLPIFQDVFLRNLEFLSAFHAKAEPEAAPPVAERPADGLVGDTVVNVAGPAVIHFGPSASEGRVREFLDTCFVLMPFGDWFDRYYTEVYAPAIRDAGFEPVRADQLFTVGAVIEQIWEQVKKATVLVADLSGRNPNVFYELGLAHAARKPVVLLAERVDDIPFDLRHLRTILYEVKSPNWATQLQREITTFLKNSRSEPEKAIPQPFRQVSTDEEDAG